MVGQQDLPDISVGEDAGFPALDVETPANPVPDVRGHMEAVSHSVSALKEQLYVLW